MRIRRFLLLAAGLAAIARPATAAGDGIRPGFDPYDPAALNEAAAESARHGDFRTAWILLERAARIAPFDGRIVRNRDEVRAHREASPATAAPGAPAAPAAAPPAASPIPPEPPALWPRKP